MNDLVISVNNRTVLGSQNIKIVSQNVAYLVFKSLKKIVLWKKC